MSEELAEAFKQALSFVLPWEGGFVNDPADRGGRTMKGVTQRVYSAFRAQQGLPGRDVKLITDEDLHALYHERYWLEANCHCLRNPLDIAQFDTAVNMGPRRAVMILQETTGCRVDGAFGAATQAACDCCEVDTALLQYCKIREGLYRKFAKAPGQAKFLRGWLNRLNALRGELGLPGFEGGRDVSFGDLEAPSRDTGFTPRIPDLAPDAPLEAWQ